jgi:hypothetical protein
MVRVAKVSLAFVIASLGESTRLHSRLSQVSGKPRMSLASRTAEVLATEAHTDESMSVENARAAAVASMEVFSEQTFGLMVTSLLDGNGPTSSAVVQAGLSKMDTVDALRRLDGKLPDEISSLLGDFSLLHNSSQKNTVKLNAAEGKGSQPFSEQSLAKARNILNGMVESAQDELDAKLIECKEFEARNRGTYSQVMTDIARLGEQVADLERLRSEANQGISSKDAETTNAEALLEKETEEYNRIKLEDEAEMTIRRNDLAVVQFILELTKCPDAFLQEEQGPSSARRAGAAPFRVCSVDDGYELRIDDAAKQAKFQRMMTPNARAMFKRTLAHLMGSKKGAAFIEGNATVSERLAQLEGDSAKLVSSAQRTQQPPGIPQVVAEPPPVQENPPDGFPTKCTDGTPNCGLLHDTMSLMWGKFKDLVDELQMEMDKKDAEFAEMKAGLNQQIDMLGAASSQFNQMLSEAIANMNADTQEMQQKQTQAHELSVEYDETMASCRAKIEEILFTNICAVRKVRNTVMTHSSVSPPEQISDCDTSDWVPGPCSVPCDDSCPQENPYECGGVQELTREINVAPNEFGIRCPALQMQRKCQQIKCPVNCVMSEWSGFSKCTKDCEGGVQGRSRSIITKPLNGGTSCDVVQEQRACNTGSCDRDCTLADWTPWSPCTMACGGGMQDRVKNVIIPIRGMGKCPTKNAPERLEERICNAHDCVGDEMCIAQQDLVIAIDSSGSLRESGSDALRDFASLFVSKLRGKYYGSDAMKVGVIQFGNGEIEEDGTVAPAINAQPLTEDMASVKTAIEGLQWQKGFTNMAQALTLADTMLQQGGRPHAQSAVLLLTDSKPSFEFMTHQKVQALKEKGTKLFFAPVNDADGDEVDLMRKWASQPWETHLVHIPGVLPLKADPEVFVQRCVATFCPKAISPSGAQQLEDQNGFFLLKTSGSCGTRGEELGRDVTSPAACAALAEAAGHSAFSFGKGEFRRGVCVAQGLAVTASEIEQWQGNRRDPGCTDGDWQADEFFDFYVIEPPQTELIQKGNRPSSTRHA